MLTLMTECQAYGVVGCKWAECAAFGSIDLAAAKVTPDDGATQESGPLDLLDPKEARSRFQFVADHRDAYGVRRLCEVLGLNRSSYHKWLFGRKARSSRQREDRFLAERIREVHGESGGAYGSSRVTAELRAKGRRINAKLVARVMRTFSITRIRLRRRVRTTVADPASSQVPGLFQRDCTATGPGRKYTGDITCLPLAGGAFHCLATVLDCFSRKVVGWSVADHMRTGLVAGALRMAASTWTAPCSTPTTGPSTAPGPSPASATNSG